MLFTIWTITGLLVLLQLFAVYQFGRLAYLLWRDRTQVGNGLTGAMIGFFSILALDRLGTLALIGWIPMGTIPELLLRISQTILTALLVIAVHQMYRQMHNNDSH